MYRINVVFSSEPLVTFAFSSNASFCHENAERYAKFFGVQFGALECLITEGSLNTRFYCPISRAKIGVEFMVRNQLRIDDDVVKKGEIIFPQPGKSVWAGTKYTFKNTEQLADASKRISDFLSKHEALRSPSNQITAQHQDTSNQLLYTKENNESDSPETKHEHLNPVSHLQRLFNELSQQIPLSSAKREAIQKLVKNLPSNAAPNLQTENGEYVDIFWGDDLMITITDDDMVCVSDFPNDQQCYKNFPNMEEALDYIKERYDLYTRKR